RRQIQGRTGTDRSYPGYGKEYHEYAEQKRQALNPAPVPILQFENRFFILPAATYDNVSVQPGKMHRRTRPEPLQPSLSLPQSIRIPRLPGSRYSKKLRLRTAERRTPRPGASGPGLSSAASASSLRRAAAGS